ncbi:MAG: hypothetical protein K2X82_04300 [Gemmataceae bacterium]|nr:hypothetical protein [Gemmataceae bacterium]
MRRVGEHPLWVGTARDARDMRAVHDAGIEAVVDLAMMCPPATPTRELVYLRFPLVDGAGNPPWLLSAAVWAVSNLLWHGVPTLVACDGGMSRSLAIATRAIGTVSPSAPPDDYLRLVAGDGPADVHPVLWAEIIRCTDSVNEPQYRPRD